MDFRIDTLFLCGRSGHARAGINIKTVDYNLNKKILEIMVRIYSLMDSTKNHILSTIKLQHNETISGKTEAGRLFIARQNTHLKSKQILEKLKKNQLLLTTESTILEDGNIEIPLEKLHYIFCEDNFDEEAQRNLITQGKHGMYGIQDRLEGFPKDLNIRFFVGGIRISLGSTIAVMEEKTNNPKIFHLASRILDPIRTTGINYPRQIEIFNEGGEPYDFDKLKLRIKLYPSNVETCTFAERVINPRTIIEGVGFSETIEISNEDKRLLKLMEMVSNGRYGLILAGQKAQEISIQQTQAFQNTHILNQARKLLAAEPHLHLTGKSIPQEARFLTDILRYVGRNQDKGKILISEDFPDKSTREALQDMGIGVFMSRKREGNNYFTSERFADFRDAERMGMIFLRIEEPMFNNKETIPAHIRRFFRGFWVKPEAIENMRKIDTIIAMYGSHNAEVGRTLRQELKEFMKRIKAHFGDKVGITHGNGPGIMLAADQTAREKNIFTLGIGIDAEKFNQQENPYPLAKVGFRDEDRLTRQKLLDNISQFKIFNIGGAGTLEEAAITMCSQKLRKGLITPIIFVDPFGLGENDNNLWSKLKEQIQILSQIKKLPSDEKKSLQLLQEYASKYIHTVESYQKAAEIIEKFTDNPTEYYKNINIPSSHIQESFEIAEKIFLKTGFPFPHWISKKIRHNIRRRYV